MSNTRLPAETSYKPADAGYKEMMMVLDCGDPPAESVFGNALHGETFGAGVFESIESGGILAKEERLLQGGELLVGNADEIEALPIGEIDHRARPIRTPHNFFDADFIPGSLDRGDRLGERIALAAVEPDDAAGFDIDVFIAAQADLAEPVAARHQAKVPQSDAQLRESLQNGVHFADLRVTGGQIDG
jgi:hypothetical protein